jgi:uncharacterized C2H2 Zn-finger protein
MDWQGPNMDELWEDYVRSSRKTEALRGLWLEEEIYAKVRELRRGHDFMTHIYIRVLVPICEACMHFEYRGYEEPKPLPDVFGSFWRDGYRTLGMSRKQIASVARALKDGDWLPRCSRCGTKIDLAHDESFYTQHVALSEYFGLHVSEKRRIPAWMKKLVREKFGSTCAACDREAETIDHIIAHAKGGLTEVVNLQPLCEQCNNVHKADKDVNIVTITLTFPLRPPPSGESDLFIW